MPPGLNIHNNKDWFGLHGTFNMIKVFISCNPVHSTSHHTQVHYILNTITNLACHLVCKDCNGSFYFVCRHLYIADFTNMNMTAMW